MMHFNVALKTDIGLKRQQNQDSGAIFPEMGLFVVADGMGGHRGGETASAMAVEIIGKTVKEAQKKGTGSPQEIITHAVQQANDQIFERALQQSQLTGMGTTATALLFSEKTLTIGHVGDSRCYFFRPGALWQLTRDHSLVQEKLRAGLISRDQLRTDRMKNVITRSVGFEHGVRVDVYDFEVQTGDVFLICSDGLSGLTDDPNILQIIQTNLYEGGGDVHKAAEELIHSANSHGGDDNITAILIQVKSQGATHG